MENRNFIFAIIISVAIMYIWGEFFAPKPAPVPKNETTQKVQAKKAPEKKKPVAAKTPTISTKPAVSATLNPEQKGSINNDHLIADYTSKGGFLTRATITDSKYKGKEIDLTAGLLKGSNFPAMSSIFTNEPSYSATPLTKNSVKFSAEGYGLKETKTVSIKNSYHFDITKTISNSTDRPISYTPSMTFNSQMENEEIFNAYRKRFNILINQKGDGISEVSDNDDLQDALAAKREILWAGVDYGYFLYAVMNDNGEALSIEGSISEDKNSTNLTVSKPSVIVSPGESKTFHFAVYYGPKEIGKLTEEGNGLKDAVSFGWTSFLGKPLLSALNFFYSFIGNYGLAIILLTVVIKLMLWPLSNASYKSMNKMKKLTPQMNALKEKYKEDKETLNRETMKLYQKEGVNPLGGCLPMFIQMPVYIALYYMIQGAVELYNAPFLPFWLTDLSAKDPFYIIPVALGALMFLQQKMMPQQMDNQQAKIMMYTMPAVFTWISLMMPAGLTLYWFVNTLLGIVQQLYINKKFAES
jgi:YidC/Oxa1 family membrane protein insertase